MSMICTAARLDFDDDFTRHYRASRDRCCRRLQTAGKAARLRRLLRTRQAHRLAPRYWSGRLDEADAPCHAERCTGVSDGALSKRKGRQRTEGLSDAAGGIA